MEESTLRQSAAQTSATGASTVVSVTVTAQPEPSDCCLEQTNALRGALTDLKKALGVVRDREEAWYRCKHGLSLSSTEPITGQAFSDATTLRGATGGIGFQIDRIAMLMGIKIE
jgi:hypothetical protein